MEIIKFKVTEKSEKKQFSATLASIIFANNFLNKVVLNNYKRLNMLVQANVLHAIYSVTVI